MRVGHVPGIQSNWASRLGLSTKERGRRVLEHTHCLCWTAGQTLHWAHLVELWPVLEMLAGHCSRLSPIKLGGQLGLTAGQLGWSLVGTTNCLQRLCLFLPSVN